MTDPFTIIITYHGEQREFTALLIPQGYTHRFKILVGKTEVFFEPDEEGSYRAVKMPWQEQKDLEKIDKHLLKLLKEKIEEILS